MAKATPKSNLSMAMKTCVPRRRKGDIGKSALEPSSLLQDEWAVIFGHHADPGKAERVHVAGLVHARHGLQPVAVEIKRMV